MFQWSTFLNLSYGFSIGFDISFSIGFGISFGIGFGISFGRKEKVFFSNLLSVSAKMKESCTLHKSKKRGIEYLHIFTMNNCCFVIIFAYIYLGAKHSLFSWKKYLWFLCHFQFALGEIFFQTDLYPKIPSLLLLLYLNSQGRTWIPPLF